MDVRLLKYALSSNKHRNVYIGRGEKTRGIPRSPLSNPFYIKNWKDDKARDESVEMFKVYLWKIMKNPSDPRHESVWNELRKLKEDSILLCYCYPRNCHGHVIVAAWKWAVAQGKIPGVTAPEPPMQQTCTNAEDLKKLETQARRNQKELSAEDKAELDRRFPDKPAAVIAPGPLDLCSIMDKLGASLGAEIPDPNDLHEEGKIIQHVCTPDTAHLIDARLDETILEKCTCDQTPATPQKPRTTRRPRLSFDEPRSLAWNEYDDATADMAEIAAWCVGPYEAMSPGLIKYLALPDDEKAKRDAAAERAERAYDAAQPYPDYAA